MLTLLGAPPEPLGLYLIPDPRLDRRCIQESHVLIEVGETFNILIGVEKICQVFGCISLTGFYVPPRMLLNV